jgi:broad-specificity NMP kinase
VLEVGALAMQEGLGRRLGRSVEVDLPALARRVARPDSLPEGTLVVGHLAHLLPVRDVLVLRCRPDMLVARLRHARRGSAADRNENFLAEALDDVLLEAVRLHRRVWEVDTTGRSVRSVAAEVEEILDRRPPPRLARVDWLADRRVSAHLLDPPG